MLAALFGVATGQEIIRENENYSGSGIIDILKKGEGNDEIAAINLASVRGRFQSFMLQNDSCI